MAGNLHVAQVRQFSKQWKIGVAQHITSVGSSPNMYGFAVFAYICMPMEPVGTLFGKNMSGSWFTNACCAIFFTNRYGFGLMAYFRFSF